MSPTQLNDLPIYERCSASYNYVLSEFLLLSPSSTLLYCMHVLLWSYVWCKCFSCGHPHEYNIDLPVYNIGLPVLLWQLTPSKSIIISMWTITTDSDLCTYIHYKWLQEVSTMKEVHYTVILCMFKHLNFNNHCCWRCSCQCEYCSLKNELIKLHI